MTNIWRRQKLCFHR